MNQSQIQKLIQTKALIDVQAKQDKEKKFLAETKKIIKEIKPQIMAKGFKNSFGHVMIVKGHGNTQGASILSGISAIRSGCGLVTLIDLFEEHKNSFLIPPEFMNKTYDPALENFFSKTNGLVVGPGLSKDKKWQEKACTLLNQASKTSEFIVIDADGLELIHNKNLTLNNAAIALTPHPGEAAALLKVSAQEITANPFLALQKLSMLIVPTQNEIIWVLKGSETIVFSKQYGFFIFTEDLPLLATAGSGDVLSGAICALAFLCKDLLLGVLLGISLQKEAAKVLSLTMSRGIFASELTALFPQLLK